MRHIYSPALPIVAFLLVACINNDPAAMSVAGPSGRGGSGGSADDVAASAGGNGGAGDGGCDIDSPVACDAGHQAAVTVTSATSTSGPVGGHGGDGGSGEGGGGSGGEAPICAAPSCAFSPDATDTINCRVDCGPLDARCSALGCSTPDTGSITPLVRGLTEILTPSLLEADASCAADCGVGAFLWTMRLRFGSVDGGSVYAVDGPDGAIAQVDLDSTADPAPGHCDATSATDPGGCIQTRAIDGQVLTIGIDSAHQSAGARFRVWQASPGAPMYDDMPVAICAGGCNGETP